MQGKVVLVTGGSRGIGREIARQMALKGAEVWLTSRSAERAREAALDLRRATGGTVMDAGVDVAQEDQVQHLAERVGEKSGHLDVLINNAGVALDKFVSVFELKPDLFWQTMQTNVMGALLCSQAFTPLLKKSVEGRIVNMSSQLANLSTMTGRTAAYRMSKAALNALTRVLASELRESGILVNAMCPGWVRTELGGAEASRSVEEGADTAVWLSSLPADGPTGCFFQDRRIIPW